MSESARAPELTTSLGWLNTDRPLRFSGNLRGQVVVLDFWTYCCINCMHILPDLAFLEEKYRNDPVQFIGVHSAKFTNEASRETIRAAILRYEIHHPVVIDEAMRIWRSYGVRSWPTLVIVDSTGHVAGAVAGEGNREIIDSAIAQALEQGRSNGTLADTPLSLRREGNVRAVSGLAFPGKILADARTKRLYVADSNHNRIVIADWPDASGQARVVRIVGTGAIGAQDGASDEATFHHPQGLAVAQDCLYVADTENHLIRSVDLTSFDVTTLVGTGSMSNDRAGGGMGVQQGLNSPWDVTVEGSTLYVAMAGVHQIWRIDLPVGFARALAGSGRENLVDGATEAAALAQPSGICTKDGNLFFADSEVSAIRGVDLAAERVFTVIGEGLFCFGDVDGPHPQARLQHPLGLEPWGRWLLVADTYNHKIKAVDPADRSARTLYGTGQPGPAAPDGGPQFFEPGGLSVADDLLFVADTNNHRVVRIDLRTHEWREIVLVSLSSAQGKEEMDHDVIVVDPISIASDRPVKVVLDVELPPHAHVSPEAPWSVRVMSGDETLIQHTNKSDSLPFEVDIPADRTVPGKPWNVLLAFAYCTQGDGNLCVPTQLAWMVPVQGGGDGDAVTLRAAVKEPA